MKPSPAARLLFSAALITGLSAFAPRVVAQTRVATYDLDNVLMSSGQAITGTFQWTYAAGDFDNGSGRFLNYQIPGWGAGAPPTQATIDTGSIEFTMVGNYHGYGLDINLAFATPLSPTAPSPLDLTRSKWQIEIGTVNSGVFLGGRILPRCDSPRNYGTGSAGSGGFVPGITSSGGDPSIGSTTFTVEADQLLGGTGGLLLMGFGKAQAPILGITLLVDPAGWITTPVSVSGPPGVPGAGTVQVPLAVPNDPLLVGMEVDFQVAVLDPGGALGVAATDGLATTICN